jgi:tRNA dimethylallyltransferase
MLQRGFLEEVSQLRKDGAMSQTARQALGYAELNRHLDGKCTLDQAIGDIVIHTRQFAVRQERWFRRDPRITWVEVHKDPVVEVMPYVLRALKA